MESSWDAALDAPASGDEAALLREALAFIGDLGLGEDESSVAVGLSYLDEPSATTPRSPKASPSVAYSQREAAQPSQQIVATEQPARAATNAPKSSGNSSYSKRRDELRYLRNLVGELEHRLVELRQRVDDESRGDEDGGASNEGEGSSLMKDAWERVAANQYEQRHKAEMENLKLKRMLEDQIQVGRSLERLLSRKRPKGMESIDRRKPVEKRQRHGSLTIGRDNSHLFDELEESIACQYPQIDRVFSKNQHECPRPTHHDIRIVHDPGHGLVLQISECHLLPFSLADTVEEFWNSMPDVITEKATGYRSVIMTEDTAKAEFESNADLGPIRADLEVSIMCRRFVEATRTVLVTCGLFNPSEISNTNMDGVLMRLRGWASMEEVMLGSGGAARPYTKIKSYSVSVPETLDHVQDKTRKVGALTNFLMTAISMDMDSRHQELENRLFQRSLRK